MKKIIIRFADTSIRWEMIVESADEATAWIDEEQSRPYWDNNWTVEIIDFP